MNLKHLTFTIALIATSTAGFAVNQPETPDSLALYDTLDELVVTIQKPVIQSDGAKTTYNVTEDPASKGANVLDMLKKVPRVTVDGEGKVRLDGQSNFKFQVNGVDNPMMSQYADQILKGMPASSVTKIEVITDPGAKEDAEGVGGIINIVTEHTQKNDGFSGNLNGNIGNLDGGLGAYGIMRKDKVTMSANFNWQGSLSDQLSENRMITEFTDPAQSGWQENNTEQKIRFGYLGGGIDFSWEPDKDNLLNITANIFNVKGGGDRLPSFAASYNSAGDKLWSFSQFADAHLNILNLTGNASFRHNFNSQKHYLILSYLLNYGKQNTEIEQRYDEIENYPVGYDRELSMNTNYSREHTVQLDYANGFGTDNHLLELGAKTMFRRNSGAASISTGNLDAPLVPDPDRAVDMGQIQDIYALYASYKGTFGSLSTIAGLRYEHSRMGIDYHDHPENNFSKRLNDIVPNVALTWSFTPMSNIRLAYQMRISRPGIDQINPFEQALTPMVIRKGNPDLKSEKSNKISLSYSNFGRVFGGSVSIEQRFTNNFITNLQSIKKNNEGIDILYNTFANLGHKYSTTLVGFFNWNIINNMNLTLNGSVEYATLNAPSMNISTQGWEGNINGSWNYTANERWHFSAYGGWNSRSISITGYYSAWHYYGLSAGYDFLSDKSLNLTVNLSNIFEPRIGGKSLSKEEFVITKSDWVNKRAIRAGVSLSWKFGQLNTQVKKTGADVEANDRSSASNKSGGSGNGF